MILLYALLLAVTYMGGGIIACVIAGEAAAGFMWAKEKLREKRERGRRNDGETGGGTDRNRRDL